MTGQLPESPAAMMGGQGENPSTQVPPKASPFKPAFNLEFITVGDQVKVGRAGRPMPPMLPGADLHAGKLLLWMTTTPCNRKWVCADQIVRFLYPEFCAVFGLKPRPVQTVLKHLKRLAKKRSRDVETGVEGCTRRKVQYFIPKGVAPTSRSLKTHANDNVVAG